MKSLWCRGSQEEWPIRNFNRKNNNELEHKVTSEQMDNVMYVHVEKKLINFVASHDNDWLLLLLCLHTHTYNTCIITHNINILSYLVF